MRVLFDQGTPVPLRQALVDHVVATAFETGWAGMTNGDLLKAAEGAFDVMITTDQNLRYQQNLDGRRLSIVVLSTTSWPVIRTRVAEVVAALDDLPPGTFRELRFPK